MGKRKPDVYVGLLEINAKTGEAKTHRPRDVLTLCPHCDKAHTITDYKVKKSAREN